MDIIDKPIDLMQLSNDELDEKLLDEKYNKANLRQLVRECIKLAHSINEIKEHQRIHRKKYHDKLKKIKDIISEE